MGTSYSEAVRRNSSGLAGLGESNLNSLAFSVLICGFGNLTLISLGMCLSPLKNLYILKSLPLEALVNIGGCEARGRPEFVFVMES